MKCSHQESTILLVLHPGCPVRVLEEATEKMVPTQRNSDTPTED